MSFVRDAMFVAGLVCVWRGFGMIGLGIDGLILVVVSVAGQVFEVRNDSQRMPDAKPRPQSVDKHDRRDR